MSDIRRDQCRHHLEMAASMQALVQHTADQHEAVTAFLEKRKPVFKGA